MSMHHRLIRNKKMDDISEEGTGAEAEVVSLSEEN